MDERQLLSILEAEERDAASYYSSELAKVQSDSLDAFHGKIAGDVQLPNRSKVVTHDIEDTVNWIMPHLIRTFLESDELITCDDNALEDDDPTLKDAANYLRHVLFNDNDGKSFIHDFAWDGLVTKVGVARVYWCDPEPEPPERLEGVTPAQLVRYTTDPEYTILAQYEDGEIEADDEDDEAEPQDDEHAELEGEFAEAGPDERAGDQDGGQEAPQPLQQSPPGLQEQREPTFTLIVQRQRRHGKVVIECIPPEEFRVSRRAKDIESTIYHAWQHDEYLADVIRQHPDKASDLDQDGSITIAADSDVDSRGDLRKWARFPDEPLSGQQGSSKEQERRKVSVLIEYIRVDFDRDDIVELRRIKRVGTTILENDIVRFSEFETWCPIRISHRLVGRSLADVLLDIQKIRTALSRFAMDSLSRSLAPRTVISKSATAGDPSLLDRFLDHDVGDVLEVNGNPGDVVQTLQTPDVSSTAFQAIEYWDRRSEEASGVNRHAMGIQPNAITDTAKGIEDLQAAANSRVELVAIWLGDGVERVLKKLLRVLIQNQDQARIVKVNGNRIECDPRRWTDEMTVGVHVGMAGESRDRKLAGLNAILTQQMTALKEIGPSPLCGYHHLRNTVALMVQTMGYKNPKRFWGDVPADWAPPPQQDPKAAEAQGKAEIAKAELQQKMQLSQQEIQGKQQLEQFKAHLDAQDAERRSQHEREIAEIKIGAENQVQQARIAADMRGNEMRLQAEGVMADKRMAQERDLALAKMAQERELALEGMKMKASAAKESETGGFRPGGRLDA